MVRTKFFKLIAVLSLVGLSGFAVYWIKTDGLRYAFSGESIFLDWNFRDFGKSVNECMGQGSDVSMVTSRVFRSAQWFSGWSCESINNPKEIVSLNFNDELEKRFYCNDEHSKMHISETYNEGTTLDNIEDLKSWDQPDFRRSICKTLKAVFEDVTEDIRFLVHCEAGRDRTGAFLALVASAAWEARFGAMSPQFTEALECDYEKSKSLTRKKYGMVIRLVEKLKEHGGSYAFIQSQCNLDPALIHKAADHLFVSNSNPQ